MRFKPLPVWKTAPFIRYIIPLATGIIAQWNYGFSVYFLISALLCSVFLLNAFNIRSITARFQFHYASGICIYLIFLLLGCILVFFKDIRNRNNWLGYHISGSACYIVTVDESLSEKAKSFKVPASVTRIITKDSVKTACGKVILYIKKDSNVSAIKQGSSLIIYTSLQTIQHSGNNMPFNYNRYCALQNIYHQAYIKPGQYILLTGKDPNVLDRLLFSLKERTLGTLRSYIKGPKERGLAEALLIGYKDDLDKGLVRSYSNTGIVHIIAISGLHVGLIYAILLLLLKPFGKFRLFKWSEPVILICALWVFSLLAGGSPSVLRSTVMFSGIIIGKSINKRNTIYNSLAASAFLLLCYNPLWLYDVGFQLSYLAVLSLIVFMKRIYNAVYIRNKLLDLLWNLASVTLAAQILTIPVCLYYFHRFPNMFLITNMVAVPLSSLILILEIILCTISSYSPLAGITGQLLEWLIRRMNDFILYAERMPFAVTENVGISAYQVIVLYMVIMVISRWRMQKDNGI